MATKITSRVIAPGAVTAEALAPGVGAGPVIANVQIANSSYVALDDTAVALDGGYILINGENFGENVQVIIANTNATSVTYVSSSLVRAQVPAKSAGSYIMYLVNTDTGATAIRVNAVTYSGTPTWSTDSTLTEGAVDETVSIQLSASSDTSVTYQLQTGSTLPTGLTLAANGLLSGTVTGLNEDTLYNFTIEAIDAENQESPRAFSITITASDADINSVVLALNADTNTFITDASTNSFAITPNGDTRPSAFSPYNTSWSNFFDGTGDFLSLTGTSAIQFGSEDFTIEGWVHTSLTNGGTIYGDRNADNFTGMVISIINSKVTLLMSNGSIWNINTYSSTTGSSITLNAWNHVAICRSGTTIYVFINGVQSYTSSFTGTLAQSSTVRIGAEAGSTAAFTGYVSNFRMVKGTALYTSSFTPSTTPLTAISGTGLLTCQSNRLIDNSTNNFAITRNGDVKVTSFGPFTETDTTTGSGYFDGTGDYLTAPANAAYNFGSDNFTVEFWFNRIAPKGQLYHDHILGNRPTSFSAGQWHIYVGPSAGSAFAFQARTPSGDIALSGGVCVENSWMHIAVVRNGTDLRLYVNGISVSSTTTSTTIGDSTSTFSVGAFSDGAYPCVAYISDIRMVKGTAVYTSNFTPPTSPLTAISGTSLLTLQNRISYNNSQPVDESGVKNIITRVGNTSIGSYTPHTPAGWSAYFDGTGDYLSTSDNAAFNFSTGNFTVEAWIYRIGSSSSSDGIFSNGPTSVGSFGFYVNSGVLRCDFYGGTGLVGTTTVPINTWNHVAVTRSGTTLRLFLNGVVDATTSAGDNNTTSACAIGRSWSNYTSDEFDGYISNLRVLKGTALYTEAFTPSTTPLEPVANTSLLTLRGPSFTDDGPNRFAITRNGDTRITPFSPFKTHTIVPDSYSVYFDSTGDYLGIVAGADGAFDFGTGDFSAEAWAYNTNNSDNDAIFNIRSGAYGLLLRTYLTTGWELYYSGSSAARVEDGTIYDAPQSAWNHHAVCRESGVLKWYINGKLAFIHASNTEDKAYTTMEIGFYSSYWAGHLSNIRVVKGSSAYTGGSSVGDTVFTPPTGPLTAISGTTLLTCQSSTVVDNSDSALEITVYGNAQPSKSNPFGDTITTGVKYSPASHGGSYYFDGTGDSLQTPATNQFAPAGQFTIECFIYLESLAVDRAIIGNYTDNATTDWLFDVVTNGVLRSYTDGSVARIQSASGAVKIGQWHHVAWTRNSSNVISMFLDGALIGTYTQPGTFGSASKLLSIGSRPDASKPWFGYISNLSMIDGTALYTSAFVPPAAPPSPVAGTTLLLNGTNAAISDGVGKNVLETIGTAQLVNSDKKYGTGSIHIPAITAGVRLPGIDFGTGDFTIEGWVKAALSGGERFFIVQGVNQTNGFLISLATDYIRFRSNGTSDILSSVFNNTGWYHFAVVRNGSSTNNVKVYYNGTQVTQGTYTNSILSSAGTLNIGPANLIGSSFAGYGYIDDFRITIGVARYTSNFTPPTSSFKLK